MDEKDDYHEVLKSEIKDNILIGSKPEKVETKSIAQLIMDSLSQYPDFIGQIDAETGEKTTFAQIKDRSIRCALWLKKQGIQKTDVISMSTPYQQNDFIPYLATIFVNAINNPWYHKFDAEQARHFFEMCRPKIMFVCNQLVELLAQVAKEIGINCTFVTYGSHKEYVSLKDIFAESTEEEVNNFEHIEPDDPKKQLGIIFFTSGTTGNLPKAVMWSYENLVHHRMEGALLRGGLNYLLYSSFGWVICTNKISMCIILRATRILHKEFHPEETSKVIEKYKVNWVLLFPTSLKQLCKENVCSRYDYSSVETIIVGGFLASERVLKKCEEMLPHVFMGSTYGMTEQGGTTVLQRRNRKRIDSLGFPYKGISIKVIDVDTGKLLGPNQQGELCFKADCMMLGYLNNPEATAEMIDNEGWLHSGDLGYYDEDGEVSFICRVIETFCVQKRRIAFYDIEKILMLRPAVEDCAVISVDGKRPFAFIIKAPGAQITEEEVNDLLVSKDEDYRLTGGILFVDKIDRLLTGKKALKKLIERAKPHAKTI